MATLHAKCAGRERFIVITKERMISMLVTLDYSPSDMQLLKAQADAAGRSVEDFIRESSMKSARNAEYLSMLDRSIRQMHEGTGTWITDEQLEALANGDTI